MRELPPLLQALESDEGWTRVGVKSGIATLYKPSAPGETTHTFKVVGPVAAAMPDVVTLLNELQLMGEWLPNISAERFSCTRFSAFANQVVSVPWPLQNREAVLWGCVHVPHQAAAVRAFVSR